MTFKVNLVGVEIVNDIKSQHKSCYSCGASIGFDLIKTITEINHSSGSSKSYVEMKAKIQETNVGELDEVTSLNSMISAINDTPCTIKEMQIDIDNPRYEDLKQCLINNGFHEIKPGQFVLN